MTRLEDLIGFFKERGRIAVAFSGGVDSSLAALAARGAYGEEALGIMIRNQAVPKDDIENARDVAEEIGIRLEILDVDILGSEDLTSGPIDRCGICRSLAMPRLIALAKERGFQQVVDGANIDDLGDHRPGHRVSTELGILHPLIELGIGKPEVRSILREEGISTHDRPSTPCMLTRLPYGERVTGSKLEIIERNESAIRGMGFRDVRFRLHETTSGGLIGVIEVDDPASALSRWNEVLQFLDEMPVLLDPRGYRQGSLNRTADP